MLEPPSPELLRRLDAWQLCQPSDLRRARRLVWRLAQDLPAFDSVWIDALVQLGRLTPYQARMLDGDSAALLRVGPYILLDEIGRSACGCSWLARSAERKEVVVVKRIRPSADALPEIAARTQTLLAYSERFQSASIVPPREFREEQGDCVFVSPRVSGVTLGELLLRRGRFPAGIVAEIGCQLAAGLQDWHQLGQVHGGVRLSHVRIDDRGRAVLVEAGLRPIIEPEMTLYASLSLEAYDGIAPELIGIGHPATPAADLYALGCLLWQLLAGRPPWAMADPLAKLAAHQTREIDDVRELAPDTPAWLADVVRQLTQVNPADRPDSAGEVERLLSRSGLPGLRGIRKFRDQFDLAVPHLRALDQGRRWTWPMLATSAAVLVIVGSLLADRGSRAELLALTPFSKSVPESSSPVAHPAVVPMDAAAGLLPLPAPAANGVLLLTAPGPYATSTLRTPGDLQIRAAAGVCPEILIRDEPLRLACAALTLDGVRIRRDSTWTPAAPLKSLVLVHAQSITLQNSLVDLGQPNPRRPVELAPAGFAWRLIEPLDPQAGALTITSTVFQGRGVGLFANQAVRRGTARNVLVLGGDAWLDLQTQPGDPGPHLELDNLTLRDGQTLVRYRLEAWPSIGSLLRLTTRNCVWSPDSKDGCLVEFDSGQPPQFSEETLVWNGEASLVPPGVPLIVWKNPETQARQPVPTDEIPIAGVIAGSVTFAGLPTWTVADSAVTATDVPRQSLAMPGIDPVRFPACLGGTADPEAISVPLTLPPGHLSREPGSDFQAADIRLQ